MARAKVTRRPCTIPHCNRLSYVTDGVICFYHYKQEKRANSTVAPREVLAKYIESHVIKGERPEDCWDWTGSREQKGYGSFELGYKHYKAHQVSYFLSSGNWAKNCVLHSCDNPPCCNPLHLRDGTVQDNSDDMRKRNRTPNGSRSGGAKLNEAEVLSIKQRIANGEKLRPIANEYGVNYMTIFDIRRERTWFHLSL